MKYIASVLLAQLGGNQTPSAADIAKILGSVGIESDNARIEALLKEISGKSIEQLISAGVSKLGSVSAGAGVAAAAPAAGASAGAAAASKQAAAPAKKQESEEEEEMGLGLFD